MLKRKHMANNLSHISDLKSGIPYRKKLKSVTTLAAFKTKIGHWKPICSCRIYRIYIQRVGFVYNHSQNTWE